MKSVSESYAAVMVPIKEIVVGSNRRTLQDLQGLYESILAIGLQTPITVTSDWRLVAGLHRLTVYRDYLHRTEIPAFVRSLSDLDAELAEIDENLIRNELTALERGEQMLRRKEIYEARFPQTKNGGDRKSEDAISERQNVVLIEGQAPPTFSEDTARKTRRTRRSVQRDVRIAAKIAPEVRDLIRETEVADSQQDLLALADMDEAEQHVVAEKIAEGAETVKEALRLVEADRASETDGALAQNVELRIAVQPGEWWQLGGHLLYCGDTSGAAFTEAVRPCAFAFADPPYNAFAAEWDSNFEWRHDWLAEKAGVVAVTPGISALWSFARSTEMEYRWTAACWIDNGMTRGAMGYGNWIAVLLFGPDGSIYRKSQDFLKLSIQASESGETSHKGRKPSGLVRWLVTLFSAEGDTVVDPFLGSGTTLLVCEATGRRCIGGELRPDFCSEIIARWEKMTSLKAERFPQSELSTAA